MALVDFIIKAKVAGYATGGESQELRFDDGSKGFEYEADGLRYSDRYYGFNPFAGTEHVYDRNDGLLWKMNYFGEVLASASDPKSVYAFLREAMAAISPEYPFRGPARFEKGGLVYHNDQQGTLDRFYGREAIFEDGKENYYLNYHGGTMNRNI